MAHLFVGMDQWVLMPRFARVDNGFDGLCTHGINSCTGLSILSRAYIFLAHIPGPISLDEPQRIAFFKQFNSIFNKALLRMKYDISVQLVTPDEDAVSDIKTRKSKLTSAYDIYEQLQMWPVKIDVEHGNHVRLHKREAPPDDFECGFGTLTNSHAGFAGRTGWLPLIS